MKYVIVLFLFGAVLLSIPAFSGELREIELKDGSVITGEVVSLSGGIYTVKSDILGTIKLEESKVRTIREKAPEAAPVTEKTGTGNNVRTLQEKMMNDREIMAMIESLKDEAEFKKLLEDPAVMKAVKDNDVAALMANPQFMKLLDNPTVKEIEKKIN